MFRSLEYFRPSHSKVIILGQDPYPNVLDACGLAFSVEHRKFPPTLRNLLLEVFEDTGASPPLTGNLEPWAKQGVLLLNRILTVREGKPLSHARAGWEEFTTKLVQRAIDLSPALVLMLFGREAQEIKVHLKLNETTLLIEGGHPSPLNNSVAFRGGRYFSRANLWLAKHGLEPIDWRLA